MTPVTNWTELPLYLDGQTMERLTGQSLRGLLRLAHKRKFPPPALTRPARWSRADVQEHWEGKRIPVIAQRRRA
jgi:hypothetical protein